MKNSIEDIIKKSADSAIEEAPSESWGLIADALHKKKKRRFIIWMFFIIFFVGLGVTGIFVTIKIKKENHFTSVSNQITIPEKFYKTQIDSNIKPKTNEKKIEKNKDYLQKYIANSKTSTTIARLIQDKETTTDSKKQQNTLPKVKKENTVPKYDKTEENITVLIKPLQTKTDNENSELIDLLVKTTDVTPDTTRTLPKDELLDNIVKEKNIKVAIIPTLEETNTTAESRIFDKKKKSKRIYLLQLNYEQLYVNKNNIIAKNSSNQILDNLNYSLSQIPTNNISFDKNPLYLNGKSILISLLVNQEIKKGMSLHFGFLLKSNSFSTEAYKVINSTVRIQNNTLFTDTTSSLPNSRYAINDISQLGFSPTKIKNNYWNIGLLVGANYSFLQLNKNSFLDLQTQIMPSLLINKSLYWLNKNNGRFFTSKTLTTKIAIEQNVSLLFKNKQKNFTIGPVYTFMYTPINKKTNNLQSLKTSSFGIQIQHEFGKK